MDAKKCLMGVCVLAVVLGLIATQAAATPYTYTYNTTLGNGLDSAGGYGDASFSKLKDGVWGTSAYSDGRWVGSIDGAGDDGIGQPVVECNFGAPTPLKYVDIQYLHYTSV